MGRVQRALDAAGLTALPAPSRPQRLPEVDLDSIAPRLSGTPRIITDRQNLPPREGLPHDDLGALLRIVAHVNPGVVLELGTAYGNATANICANSSAHVYTVNALPEQLPDDPDTLAIERDEIGIVYRQHGFADRVTQIFGDTLKLDLAAELKGRQVDLAVIDACHKPHHVVNDFHSVQRVLQRGAVVLLHDTHPSGARHLWGSTQACLRLRCQGFDIRHIRGTWWGYWRKSRSEDLRRAVADISRRFTGRMPLVRQWRRRPARQTTNPTREAPAKPAAAGTTDPATEAVDTTYLFVLCPPFSGSTVLWKLLATSPAVSALPGEGQFLPQVSDWMAPRRWDPDKQMPWDKIQREWDRIWDPGLPIHLEKSPAHIVRAEQIERHFEPAAFVAMVRNPYALCQGLTARQGRSATTAAEMWVKWARYQMHNIRNLRRVLFFTYEELTEKPAEVAGRLVEFLPELQRLDHDGTFSVFSVLGRSSRKIRNLNQPKIDMLSGEYVRQVNEVLGRNEDVMRFFGYELLTPDRRHAVRHAWAMLKSRTCSLLRSLSPVADGAVHGKRSRQTRRRVDM
ncbi:MAG: class I SAM-dependent methyltransferase [Phycisphaerae bacterium]